VIASDDDLVLVTLPAQILHCLTHKVERKVLKLVAHWSLARSDVSSRA
jgi:hypothetical protein